MHFWRKQRAATCLALVVMLAYALVPPGLLAACGCGDCACAAENDAGKCCCSQPLGHVANASADSSGLKPCCQAKATPEAAATCQQACSLQDACVCSPVDGSQPARTAQSTEVEQQDQVTPLPGLAPPVDFLVDARISDIASSASLAPSPPLRVLLCHWRN